MKYVICVQFKSEQGSAEIKDVARDVDATRAIKSFVRGRNIAYAHTIYADPANKKSAFTRVWCEGVRCSVSGRVTIQRIYVEHIDGPDASV